MTPKPGQIRCPTCLRSTPPAAYCTQCGSPVPPSARTRPRGLDRDELEERVRRRPGEGPFRRGSQVDESPSRAGYVPYEPQPEDALAVRPEEEAPVYSGPPEPEADDTRRIADPEPRPQPEAPRAAPVPPPRPADEPVYPPEAYDDRPYGEPEDAYPYPYVDDDRGGGGGGGSALPIIGFVVLGVLALAVGAVLAGMLNGDDGVGQATPSASVASQAPTVAPTEVPSSEPSESGAPSTPEPSDGPVAFPDGALLTIQPCATNGYRNEAVGRPDEDACQVDGSSVDNGEVWAFVVFRQTAGSDSLRVRLLSNDEVVNEQDLVLGSILTDCGDSCNGLIYGAHYVQLLPGDYELVLHRNGEFADRAGFVVE